MGMTAVIGKALKGVAWGKVAGLAMEYGPVLYRAVLERLGRDEQRREQELAEESAQHERLERLERLLVEQEAVIREQKARNEQLEAACRKLEGRLNRCRIAAAVLSGVSILLAAMLLGNG